ncbi:MAG: sensor histidine kinase [Oscillospiraceae bacterium]|nr:sensor histidine kinase [Oscillospiraceae bacterium]
MPKISLEAELLKKIPHPAFFVADGIITKANRKAALLKIKEGTAIDDLLRTGFDEYATYSDGRLCLTLTLNRINYDASVVRYHDRDLFFVENEFHNPDLCMLSATVNPLLDPLSCAMLSLDTIKAYPELKDKPELTALTHHFYRIHKIVSDMHDAAFYNTMRTTKMGNYELTGEIKRIITKAATLLREANLGMDYTCEATDEFYGFVDMEKIERAILTLTSDLFYFTKENARVKIKLRKERNRMLLSLQCRLPDEKREYLENMLLSCHIDNDGLDAKKDGFNGAILARNAVSAHFGTMLIDSPRAKQLRFTFSIPLTQNVKVHTSHSNIEDYAGGFDHYLLAFSELLSDEFYK